jgi:hypothetical protein
VPYGTTGRALKNTASGGQLAACRLEFDCPYQKKRVSFTLPAFHLLKFDARF